MTEVIQSGGSLLAKWGWVLAEHLVIKNQK
jgi:hypothetical protein